MLRLTRESHVRSTALSRRASACAASERSPTPVLTHSRKLHQSWISNVETGKRNPSYGSPRRLASGLGLAASEMIARAETNEGR